MQTTGGIVALVHFYIGPVVAARKEVGADQRVVVKTLIGHVAVILYDITGSYIQFHLVIQEMSRIAKCEIISVVPIVRNHPF